MKRILVSILICCLSTSVYANNSSIIPCVKPITITSDVTALVIPVSPLRSVSMIFPETFRNGDFTYLLSSDNIFAIKPPENSSTVDIYYKAWDNRFGGAVRDLKIRTKSGLYLTISLVATANDYCGTLIVNYSDEVVEKIARVKNEKEKENISSYKKQVLADMDNEVNDRVVQKIGSIVSSKPKKLTLKEKKKFKTETGVRGEIQLANIKRFGEFSVLTVYIYNDSSSDFDVSSIDFRNESDLPVTGHIEGDTKVKPSKENKITFSTLTNLPETGGNAYFLINGEKVAISW